MNAIQIKRRKKTGAIKKSWRRGGNSPTRGYPQIVQIEEMVPEANQEVEVPLALALIPLIEEIPQVQEPELESIIEEPIFNKSNKRKRFKVNDLEVNDESKASNTSVESPKEESN